MDKTVFLLLLIGLSLKCPIYPPIFRTISLKIIQLLSILSFMEGNLGKIVFFQ